jgi:serine phosphatase RsbU (regulator of sigma subunit)
MIRILAALFCFLLFSFSSFAESKTSCPDTISILNFKTGVSLEKCWKYKTGDNPSWAAKDIDETSWGFLSETDEAQDSILDLYSGILWMRAPIFVDSILTGTALAIRARTSGACDIFIDGKLVHSLGKVGVSEKDQVSGFSIRPRIIPVVINTPGLHQIAIRSSGYANQSNINMVRFNQGVLRTVLSFEINSMQEALKDQEDVSSMTIPIFFSGVFLVLSIFHFILFLFYRKNRSNLYYSLFTLFLFIIFFGVYLSVSGTDLQTTKNIFTIGMWSVVIVPLLFIGLLYEVFYKKPKKLFWILASAFVVSFLLVFVFDDTSTGVGIIFLYIITCLIETFRIFIRAFVKKKEGSRIFIFGMLFPVSGLIALSIVGWFLETAGFTKAAEIITGHNTEFFFSSLLMSVSISMTIYLASDFSRMNRKLNDQLKEIKHLFNRTIEQENEKKKILEGQKEELERQVALRTEEVVMQKAEIETKNHDIMDNLFYAKRIQEAILPDIGILRQVFRNSFIIYRPKDVVSGDFYSWVQKGEEFILAAADCTGHGVTGAFMSMIGSSVLNQVINERGITQPSLVLNNLNQGISESLRQSENDVSDGMDIALCTINTHSLKIQYAGANRPLWLFRNGTFTEIKPDKLPIGGFRISQNEKFVNHEIQLQKEDTIYIFTDGYADQFGGPYGKKILSKNLREFLLSIQPFSMEDQEKKLTAFFLDWKKDTIQVDDVLMIGVRV